MGERFDGLGKGLVAFLRDLEKNNKREWFQKNKERYQECVQEPMLAFIRALAPKLERFAPHIVASDSKTGGSLMRIHRDVRFSKDKRPYNTHVSAQFRHERGKNVHAPGFYVRIDPKEVWLGTGIWQPDTPAVTKIRKRIAAKPAEWKKARDGKTFKTAFGELGGESLKRPPRGFDPEHAYVEDLKRKDFVAFRKLKPAQAAGPGFLDEAVKAYKASGPFMEFLCEALRLRY